MQNSSQKIISYLVISLTLLYFVSAKAQCSGSGSEITICNKETDATLQTFNLFDLLTDETPGGKWIADSNFNAAALNSITGELNIWAINTFGPHTFTYSNPACDTSTAQVTVNLGGYPGEDNRNAGANNVCQLIKILDDDDANIIDLFIFLGVINSDINPDEGGIWTEHPDNLTLGLLNNEFFNFRGIPEGVYTFTYTTPVVGVCPERSATVDVTLRRTPNPGITNNINLCELDDKSSLTAVNLFDRLDGEDSNGVWIDKNLPRTGELSDELDSEIDIQNIYNNFGPGNYRFDYTVLPKHPICEEQISSFFVCIEKQLNLEGSISVTCDGLVTIAYNDTLFDNNVYNIIYTVAGNSSGSMYTDEIEDLSFQDGIAQFNLFPDFVYNANEAFTITINDIITFNSCGDNICPKIITVPPKDFNLYIDPIIVVTSTRECEFGNVTVAYVNTVDTSLAPLNGTFPVTYSINSITYTDNVAFINGNATALVPSERFISGTNELTFFETNNFIHCGNIDVISNLDLIPVIPNPVFSITPNALCNASNIEFGFNSPEAQAILYSSVTFDIYPLGSEPEQFDPRNTATSLSNNIEGNGIDIDLTNNNDVSALPNGDYVFVIRSVQTDNIICRNLSLAEINAYADQGITIGMRQNGAEYTFDARLTFRIGEPNSVTLENNRFEVCSDTLPITLGDLPISAGTDVSITLLNASGTEVNATYPITTNEDFTTVFSSAVTGCDLGEDTFTVTLLNPTININDFNTIQCSVDLPTLNDVYLGEQDILWFDAAGSPVLGSKMVQNGTTYFAQTQQGECLSTSLELTTTVIEVSNPSPSQTEIQLCGINEKTITDILEDDAGNLLFNIPVNHNLFWYDSDDVLTRNILDENTVLESRNYYATYQVEVTIDEETIICESASVGILVDLTACSEDELFIPDAFSPNGDTINDTFELQNIDFVFPNYSIEIYNRYGRIVFKGNTQTGFWDGKSNQNGLFSDAVVPTGVYFYVINFNRFDRKPYQGQVYLKR